MRSILGFRVFVHFEIVQFEIRRNEWFKVRR